MGTKTLRPSATESLNGWTVVGAATAHEALADESDASYVDGSTATSWFVQFRVAYLDDIPALAQIRSLTYRVRVAQTAGARRLAMELKADVNVAATMVPTPTIQTLTYPSWTSAPASFPLPAGPWLVEHLQQLEDVGGMSTHFNAYDGAPSNNFRVYAIYLDVAYNEAPVVDVTGPADEDAGTAGVQVVTTSTPTIAWAYTDPEGDIQERARVKVFREPAGGWPADLQAFAETNTEDLVWDSGDLYTSATSVVVGELLENGSYGAFVKAADAGSSGRYSAWDWRFFTQNVQPPPVPTLDGVADNAAKRVTLTARSTGAPNVEFVRFEYSDDGGATWATVRGGSRVVAASGVDVVVDDYESPFNVARQYRAKAGRSTGSGDIYSAASPVDAATVASVDWWLKDPTAPALNAAFDVEMPTTESVEDQHVFRPAGRTRAVVLAGTLGGEDGTLEVDCWDQAAFDAFERLRATQRVLLLQSPFGGDQRYVRLGAVRRAALTTAGDAIRRRRVTVPYVETDPPA